MARRAAPHLALFNCLVAFGLIVGIVCLARVSAQVLAPGFGQPSRTGTGLILGRVVDGTTAEPIASARVICSCGPPWLVTDDQGRFVFFDLPPGKYSFSVTKPGYMQGELGQRWASSTLPLVMPGTKSVRGQSLTLAAGERRTDITVRLWKEGAIAGRVVDGFGEALVGVLVQAWAQQYQAGRLVLNSALPVIGRTDDRGMYRIVDVLPGSYVVVVAQPLVTTPTQVSDLPRSSSAFLGADLDSVLSLYGIPKPSAGSPGALDLGGWFQSLPASSGTLVPADGSGDLSYRTIFHAGALSAKDASSITVSPGEDVGGIDFQLRRERVHRVSGHLTGPQGPAANVTMRLVEAAESSTTIATGRTATTVSDGRGAFMFAGIPAGEYLIQVLDIPRTDGVGGWQPPDSPDFVFIYQFTAALDLAAQTLWALVPLTVAADVHDVNISLRQGTRLTGSVQFSGAATPPSGKSLTQLSVLIDRAEGTLPTMRAYREVEIAPSGEFHTIGLPPGKYFVRVPQPPPGWTLHSVELAGQDVSEVPTELRDESVGDIVIRFTDRPSIVSGSVRTRDGQPDPNASVAVFPVDRRRWIDYGWQPRDITSTRVDADGHYEIRGLPRGEYCIVAVDDAVLADWNSPQLFEALSRVADRVRIGDSDARAVELVTRSVGK